jgi:hypothetical protein
MKIHYKIVEMWPNDHIIVARYWTDKLSQEMLASDELRREDGSPVRCRSDVSITIPIPEPDEKGILELIEINTPLSWLTTLETVIDPTVDTGMKNAQALYNVEIVKDAEEIRTDQAGPSTSPLTDEEIQEMIAKISVESK